MTSVVYPIHRAINRPVILKGIKGQYILYAAAGLIGDLLLFVILFCCKLPSGFCVIIALSLGAATLATCARMSRRYGVYGLMKKRARRQVPPYLCCHSRKLYTKLKK